MVSRSRSTSSTPVSLTVEGASCACLEIKSVHAPMDYKVVPAGKRRHHNAAAAARVLAGRTTAVILDRVSQFYREQMN